MRIDAANAPQVGRHQMSRHIHNDRAYRNRNERRTGGSLALPGLRLAAAAEVAARRAAKSIDIRMNRGMTAEL